MRPLCLLLGLTIANARQTLRRDLTAGTEPNTSPLSSTGCHAPRADGGWGYCGPDSCQNSYVTCSVEGGGPATIDGVPGSFRSGFSENTCEPFLTSTQDDVTDWNPRGRCDASCSQVATGVCAVEFLERVLVGDGVKYAFCNDKWLVIMSDGHPSVYEANLNDVPFPPGATDITGASVRTGMASMDRSRTNVLAFPLFGVTDLPTATGANNADAYDNTDGISPKSHLAHQDGTIYGLPADGAIGLTVSGQPMFPVFNNNAEYTPQKCEVDSCQEHVGQGGGAPHLHGDPFGDEQTTRCLYGPSNYSSTSQHPPIIGFSFDGHLIYGRHLTENDLGYTAPGLDACGGHSHTATGDVDEHGNSLGTYHYHAQIFAATVGRGNPATEGEAYLVSTPGPFQCFKADIEGAEGSSALLAAQASPLVVARDMTYRCCGMTDYYALTGVAFDTDDVAASSMCTAPAAPEHGAYEDACATPGSALLSGYTCAPTCISGFTAIGTTRCVAGSLVETATCVGTATTSGPTPAPTPAPATSEPIPSPTQATEYCQEGYADYGVRYNWAIGKITITASHEACSARCTQYSGPQYLGGCKAYQTGMYYGMLFCRSYGGSFRTTGCASWANPTHPGVGSGALGDTHPRTNTVNIGGNCCSNSTFVAISEAADAGR